MEKIANTSLQNAGLLKVLRKPADYDPFTVQSWHRGMFKTSSIFKGAQFKAAIWRPRYIELVGMQSIN